MFLSERCQAKHQDFIRVFVWITVEWISKVNMRSPITWHSLYYKYTILKWAKCQCSSMSRWSEPWVDECYVLVQSWYSISACGWMMRATEWCLVSIWWQKRCDRDRLAHVNWQPDYDDHQLLQSISTIELKGSYCQAWPTPRQVDYGYVQITHFQASIGTCKRF